MTRSKSIAVGILTASAIFILGLAFYSRYEECWWIPVIISILFGILLILYISDNKKEIKQIVIKEVNDDCENSGLSVKIVSPAIENVYNKKTKEEIDKHEEELWKVIAQISKMM